LFRLRNLLTGAYAVGSEQEECVANKSRDAIFIAAYLAALVAVGVIVWALSDYTPVNPPAVQTESIHPKQSTPAQ
jgi:hypothetical protein